MNHAYYVPSQQISYHIQQQACLKRNPENIGDQLKLLKSKKHVNQSLHNNKDYLIKQHQFKSQKNISLTKLHSTRRQKSQEDEQTQQIQQTQQTINPTIKQLSKQSKCINGYLVKQQLHSNSYQSIKQKQITDYHTVNKDKTIIKTEPDTQHCSDKIICYKTPIIIPKQIQSKEQIKSICNQIYTQNKQTDEITNLKLDINYQNHRKNSKLKIDVQEKILDLLMLSTRELKIKLSDKRTKQTSIPKTTKAGLPVDFFNFKK